MKRREGAGGGWKSQKWRPLCRGNAEARETVARRRQVRPCCRFGLGARIAGCPHRWVPAPPGAGSACAWEEESGQRSPGAEGLALGAGGGQLGPGVEVPCPADPSSLPPTGGAAGSPAPQTA